MFSRKTTIDPMIGIADAVSVIVSILTFRDGMLPPTLNLANPSVEGSVDLVPHEAKRKRVDVVLSNSFGFSGTNTSLATLRV